jgi:hypothetical protein
MLAMPNPLHQSILCCEISDSWPQLNALCQESQISLSAPQLSTKRALDPEYDRRRVTIERARRSIGTRYVLKADLARFYPSIYTHSIAWAVHGKEEARVDRANQLAGNRLDLWVRETQDKQTGGLPIGPDTSYLLAEVVASRLDLALQTEMPSVRGTRHIDDYNLYFATLSEAEKALAVLHRAARRFELEINDLKTEIVQVPEALEPYWKTQLRSLDLRDDDHGTSLKSLFDRAAELSEQFKQDSVHTYAVKKVLSKGVPPRDWETCETLILRAALGEPSLLPWLLQVYEKCSASKSTALGETIEALCHYHSPLQQGSEVAWALWIARALDLTLSEEAAEAVATIDDDIVALVALDMMDAGLLPAVDTPVWNSHMNAEGLYSDHWLLAYEAYEQDWLRPIAAGDYIAADAHGCFTVLRKYAVRFYDPDRRWEGGYPSYSDDTEDTSDAGDAEEESVEVEVSDIAAAMAELSKDASAADPIEPIGGDVVEI